jgi:hypothetical protein
MELPFLFVNLTLAMAAALLGGVGSRLLFYRRAVGAPR